MKIFNKEISKKAVKLFIGGVVATIIGGTIIGVVTHNNKEQEAIADVEVIEIELQDESIEE